MSDTYAVVDKSKKSNKRASTQVPLSSDPMADLYSVVDKSHKSKPDPTTLTEDTYEAVPADKSAALYASASAPIYSKLDHTPHSAVVVNNTYSKKLSPVQAEISAVEDKRDQKKGEKRYPVWMLACFIVLIMALIVVSVAVAMAFVLIANLHSDWSTVMKDSSSSSGRLSENDHLDMNSLTPQLNQLHNDFSNFTVIVTNQVLHLNQNTSDGVEDLYKQINSTLELLTKLNNSIYLLTSSAAALEGNFSEQLDDLSNDTSSKLQNLNTYVSEAIANASVISSETITTLTGSLINGIQTLHTFESCTAVSMLSILLPPGMYNIRSGDSVAQQYCKFSCNGISGGWKRIAYLNTNEIPVSCPDNFEVRDPISNPPLCRRTSANKGCNSVAYPSNGTSYSQVCGTVRVHPEGTPDGFDTFNDRSIYVDGVYLTYGDSSNRNHIWTYTAAITVGSTTRGCGQCNYMKPSNMPGNNFTCTISHCSDGNSCFSNTLWGNEAQQCVGNESFYRQLSESTTDNIEMRVCRDQGRDDEDILISYVELYVL